MLVKTRLAYAGATFVMLAAGLGTRTWSEHLPEFVSLHFGDALWAAMIYCGFRAVLVHKRVEWALLASFIFCMAIEFSQLYQADWINAVRSSRLGALVLGRGFLAVDLFRYGVGIALVYVGDKLVRRMIRGW